MQVTIHRPPVPRQWTSDPWLLASFSVPESERQNRHKIRAGLARLGFGTVAPGLCIAPARLQIEALNYMREHELSEYVEFFTSQPVGPGDLRSKVAQWWDLAAVESEYRAFVNSFGREADSIHLLLSEQSGLQMTGVSVGSVESNPFGTLPNFG